MSNSQASANLNGSSQPEASVGNTDTDMSTELQMASALMQLKTGQPVIPIPSQKPVTSSMTNPSQSVPLQAAPSTPSKPTILTVMQTSFLPSGQCLLVPQATNSSTQQSTPATAVILSSPNSKTEENAVQAPPKPIFFSFLPSSQFQSGTTLSSIPVLKVAMPVTSSQIQPPSQSCLPPPPNTSPTTHCLHQPLTFIPNPTVSPTSQTTQPNNPFLLSPHFIATKPGPRPIAPKGNPPSNVGSVQAQLDAIRELLAQDGEAYQKLMEKQQLYETQAFALQASRPSTSPTGIAAFPISNLHVLPMFSSPTVQSPPTVQMSSSEQKIEQLQREIMKQHRSEGSPPRKPLQFHQYTPQKQSKESLQFHQYKPQMQSVSTPLKIQDINEEDTDCHLTMSPYSAFHAARLKCSEELSPATPRPASIPSTSALHLGNELHAKRWQQAKPYATGVTRRSKETPQKPVSALAQTNLSRLPIFQEQPSSESHQPVLSVPMTQASDSSNTSCLSSFPGSCSGKCPSTFKPVFSQTDHSRYFTAVTGHHESGAGCFGASEMWNFLKQREP